VFSVLLAPYFGLAGLALAFVIYRYVVSRPPGSGAMIEISEAIHTGAMVFLRKEYTILAGFIVVVALLLGLAISRFTALAFLSGAASSMLAGLIGMQAPPEPMSALPTQRPKKGATRRWPWPSSAGR